MESGLASLQHAPHWRISVRFVVGGPGFDSSRRVRPKDLNVGIHSFPAWRSTSNG